MRERNISSCKVWIFILRMDTILEFSNWLMDVKSELGYLGIRVLVKLSISI